MEWNRKRILVAAGWLVSLLAANYLGGVVGFSQGYATARGLAGDEAFVTTSILRLLRQERVPEAIHLLEVTLDGQIGASVFGDAPRTWRSLYNLWLRHSLRDAPVERDAAALAQVLTYREEFPPVVPDAATKEKLMKALAVYHAAPPPAAPKKE